MRKNRADGLILISVISSLCIGTMINASADLTLVKAGKPEATLILAVRPRQAARLAAEEFQHYTEKMTGCRLPEATDEDTVEGTRVLIGESKLTRALGYRNEDFLKDESIVKTGLDYLLIVGRDRDSYGPVSPPSQRNEPLYPNFGTAHDVGTVYGVIDFLERECNIRWYLPGEIGEVVPQKQSIILGTIERRRRPWARERRIAAHSFPRGLYYWDKTEKQKRGELADKRTVQRWWLHMKNKFEPFYAGHMYARNFFGKLHENHPEYFAQGHPLEARSQPCFTNPNVIDEVVKMAGEYFDQPADKRVHGEYFSVSPNDSNRWCQCSRCQAKFSGARPKAFWNGYASKYIWEFVNEVARVVKQTHPDKGISCYAYWEYFLPPEGLRLEPNIAVQFCRPLPHEWNPTEAERFKQSFTSWAKLAKRVYLYDYFCFPQYSAPRLCMFPCWMPHRIVEDLRRMKSLGLRGAYNDIHCERTDNNIKFWANPAMDQINFYLWFRYLDDMDRDVDEVLDEFYERFYGPAGEFIKAFISKGEALYWDCSNYDELMSESAEHLDEEVSWESICPPDTLKEFGEIMASAHRAAQTPREKQRVELFDNGVNQMMKASSRRWFEKRDEMTPQNSQKMADEWRFMPDASEQGVEGKWFDRDLDDSSWRMVSVLSFLEEQGYEDYRHGWYRTEVFVPEGRAGGDQKVVLRFGAVDETCWVWINGEAGGEFAYNPVLDSVSWSKPLRFDITKFVRFGEKNQVTVLVQNLVGKGGIWNGPSYILYRPDDWDPDWCEIVAAPKQSSPRLLPYYGIPDWSKAALKGRARPERGKAAGDLIACYDFDRGSGQAAHDRSGNGYHARIVGAVWAEGKHGSALKFNGAGDYVDCGEAVVRSLQDSSYTLEAWIKPAALGDRYAMSFANMRLGLSGGKCIFWQGCPGWSHCYRAGGGSIVPDHWYHIAGVFDKGKSVRLYINGLLIAEDISERGAARVTGPFYIGTMRTAKGRFFAGVIDEVRVHSRILTEEEIRGRYGMRGE